MPSTCTYDYNKAYVHVLELQPLHRAKARLQALNGIFGDLVLLDEIMLHASFARGFHDLREIKCSEANLAECVWRKVL